MADPTVTDVFNQLVLVNGKLDQVEVNTSLISNLNNSINIGFKATVDALHLLALINAETAKLEFHQTQQLDTVICTLEHISKNTCEILTQVTVQTSLQRHLSADIAALRYIAESAEPAAALNAQRDADLTAKIERCCPPETERPACDYSPCDAPGPIDKPKLPNIPKGAEGGKVN